MGVLIKKAKKRLCGTRQVLNFVCIALALVILWNSLSVAALAATPPDFVGYPQEDARTVLKVDRTSPFTYNFSKYGPDNLPPEFARVCIDLAETLRYEVHGDSVNFYYTPGPGPVNRAVYCFESDNPYLFENGSYYILRISRLSPKGLQSVRSKEIC